ncbi:conserved protein of unknown function [Methylocella tundrae]|uniref:Uncharacterized protein n=1 Tax=Methylocella tundrae TaxID=227605 RepID=A0A4U8Z1T3_METTU|nr:conserved protein of unknown function [Methylocella tundrae]
MILPSAWRIRRPARILLERGRLVLRRSIVLLYTGHLALLRCNANLNTIGDRAEIRPPICWIASGSGGLAYRKEEKSWLK